MSGKRKREDDDFEFATPSAKISKAQKEEVTRSGRSRKKPARFLDESIMSIEEDIDKIEEESDSEDEDSYKPVVKTVKSPPVKQTQPQQKLLLQTLQSDQKPMTILAQQKVQPIQIQMPGSNLVQRVAVPQGIRLVSPTSPQIQVVSTAVPQLNVVSQLTPQVKQQPVPQIVTQSVVQSPTTPPASQAGNRGRVRKKSAKVLEMEEFEEAEKTKPKKPTGKQQSPISPVQQSQQSPIKQLPPTGITIVKNEQGQNVVLSVAGGIPNVKAEPQLIATKNTKAKGKSKDSIIEESSLLVKEEPSDSLTALAAQIQEPKGSSKKQKQTKSDPTTKKQGTVALQESPPTPTKKGKSVIKMLLNTPTQFTPTVSTTAISSDKVKETEKNVDIKSDTTPTNVKKILMSPSDLDDSHLSDDEDEDDDEFDDELDDDEEGDDEDDMDWQFENMDGKELSPTEVKKTKKRPSKKKTSHEEDDFDDDDFGDDDDDDDDEGNLVIADEVSKKKKTTKKAPSKKKDLHNYSGKPGVVKPEKPVKEKKKKRLTAYTMWCNSMRTKVLAESPGIDFAQLSKRLGEIWQGLPSRDKMSWKRKAKREVRKLLGKGLISTGKAAASTPATSTVVQQKATPGPKSVPPIHHTPITHHKTAITTQKLEEHAVQLRGSGIEPIDVAAYLKLVGESLSIIGMRLQEHRGLIAVQGSLSVLLDSLLCALGPLMCLTTQIPELHGCPAETHNRTLDNLAYFMPGL